VWAAASGSAYLLALLWPDFISIGERLRDYAILSSVLQHPLEAREPWMSGAVLNYYLYWYRFGAMLRSLGWLSVWQTYHVLQSVTLGLYCAVFYRFFTRHLRFEQFSGLACAALITLGSNIAGVLAYAHQDSNWWGPSRVIPGTINEFPAWSFLLGDLHPHFLNLPLLPVMVLIVIELRALLRGESVWIRLGAALASSALAVAWTFGANAWEVPFVLITLGVMIVGVALYSWRSAPHSLGLPRLGVRFTGGCIAALLVLCGVSWLQSRNITPPGDPLRLVTLPLASQPISAMLLSVANLLHLHLEPPVATVTGSSVQPFLMHWGFPVGLLSLSLIVLSRDWVERIGKTLAVVFGYLSGAALLLLGFIGILQLWRIIQQLWSKHDSDELSGLFVVELLGIAAVLGIMFPEILFVDDPYGGADERMNTVFKFYSAAWGFLHLAAFALAAEALKRCGWLQRERRFFWGGWAVVLTLSLGFFVSTIKYRMTQQFTIEPYAQGLSGVEAQFPGAGTAIQKLEKLPRGVVLEAQGGAYNFSSMVSTLSANEAFLGWANHVNLLTRNYGEVARREQLTKDFYTHSDCNERKAIMEREGIRYAVLGRLERQNYGQIDESALSCLTRLIHEGEYSIYSTSALAQQ
jgi:uncharacterized membrane protein